VSRATIDLRCDDPILYKKIKPELEDIGFMTLKEDYSVEMEEVRVLLKYKEMVE